MAEQGSILKEETVRDASPTYSAGVCIATAEGVPLGYKRTEVGVIPEDWDVVSIGELAKTYSGGTPSTNRPEYYGGDIPWITSSDLNHRTISEPEGRITRLGLEKSSAKLVEPGTLVVALYGATAGVSAITHVQAAINQAVLAIVTKNASAKFLLNMLSFKKNEYVEKLTQGGQPNLSGALVRSIKVPAPSEEEQCAIATALSDADALIASLDRLIAKKRAIKQAAMQQLLTGQTRLPGFTDEWGTERLGEIADIRSGGTPSTAMPAFWNGDVPWCTPTDITELGGRKYLSGTERTISHAGLRASSAESMPSGSIIMTTRATIGECAINTVPMTTNQGFKNLIPSSCDAEFLYYLMTTKKAQLIQLCGGSTFLEIGKKSLLAFEVALPQSHQEQQAIATVLSDMDSEVEALEHRRYKARQLKQGMMQQLLTGRVRLVEPEVENVREASA